jgi:hypothetical protein
MQWPKEEVQTIQWPKEKCWSFVTQFYFTFIQKEQLVAQYVDYVDYVEHLTLTADASFFSI